MTDREQVWTPEELALEQEFERDIVAHGLSLDDLAPRDRRDRRPMTKEDNDIILRELELMRQESGDPEHLRDLEEYIKAHPAVG